MNKPKKNTKDKLSKKLIAKLIEEKGGSEDDYITLADTIAFHESKLDPTSHQIGGGPGRGLYQFEQGEKAGASTALKRLKAYAKQTGIELPEDLVGLNPDKYNPAELPKDYQDALFFANYRKHPVADFKQVISGQIDIPEFWGVYHQTQNDPEKLKPLKRTKKYLI